MVKLPLPYQMGSELGCRLTLRRDCSMFAAPAVLSINYPLPCCGWRGGGFILSLTFRGRHMMGD